MKQIFVFGFVWKPPSWNPKNNSRWPYTTYTYWHLNGVWHRIHRVYWERFGREFMWWRIERAANLRLWIKSCRKTR